MHKQSHKVKIGVIPKHRLSLGASYLLVLAIYFAIHSGYCVGQSNGNEPYFGRIMSENIKVERGLSQNSVVSIIQDTMGYMWFGTFDGLNRFDGYDFTIFNKEQGLSNESIRSLLSIGDTVWVGTEYGLNRIILSDLHIEQYYNHQNDISSLSDNWINNLYKDHDRNLWVCTAKGLNVFDASKNCFRQYRGIEARFGLTGLQYNAIVQDSLHNYYFATNLGLFVMAFESGEISWYSNEPLNVFSLPSDQVNVLAFDQKQRMFVGTKNGLVFLNDADKTFHRLNLQSVQNKALDSDNILSLCNDNNAGIWIGTYANGLFLIHEESDEIQGNLSNRSHIYSLSNNRVMSIFQSEDSILWVGTFNGLNKFDKDAPKFKSYRASLDYMSGFSSNQVWTFLEQASGEMLVGTDNGMSVFDQKQRIFSQSELFNGEAVGLKNKQIRCLFKDSRKNYWIGTRHDGLYRYDPVSGKHWIYRNIPSKSETISNDFVLDIVEDRKGHIWVATGNGLNRFERDGSRFVHFYANASDVHALPDNKLYDLYLDKNDQLWISTENGLAAFHEQTANFTTYKMPEQQLTERKSNTNSFFSVVEDHNGMMWLGTRGGGLVRFDRPQNAFKVLTVNDGLPDNVVYLILVDRNNDLWVTTNWGLSRYNPQLQSFSNFDITDGLLSNEFNWNAGCVASDGEIYVGGMNGFNTFYPEEIRTHTGIQHIQITSFKKFNIVQNKALHDGDTIYLRYDDNFFSFGFSALDYTNPSKTNYRCMLGDYETKWIEKDADHRIAEYTRVPPGTYLFRLMASNTIGEWNDKELNIHIIIKPPWYATWLFRILVVAFITLIIYYIIVVRIRFVRKKHAAEKQYFVLEKKLYQLEQKALQLQMNPHFLFNSLNSIQGLILGNDIDGAIHYLSKFSQLMRKTLYNSSESFIPLREEVNTLTLFIELESFRFGDRFDYSITVDPKIDQDFTKIPPMILQPYVENAIVHGLLNSKHKGQLSIEMKLQGHDLHCVIQDDGVGRKRATEIRLASGIERKSKGMSITSERLAILNQFSTDNYSVQIIDLMDEQGHAVGTRVEVNLNLKA